MEDIILTMRDRTALAWLTLLTLAITLPFVRRAYFVDDFYHMTMAKGLLDHPLKPYDFRSDDAGPGNLGWDYGKYPRMVNPPLFHYAMAGVMKVWGNEVWKLRTASLLFSLISVWSMYFLGKRWSRVPLGAACLMAVTPAFWLTAYSLLIDGALLAWFLSGLLFFIKGHEEDSFTWAFLSGVLMAFCFLTKYTGILVVAVVLLWHITHRSRAKGWYTVTALIPFIGLVGLWAFWTFRAYGHVHFIAAFHQGAQPAQWAAVAVLGFLSLALYMPVLIPHVRKRPWLQLSLIILAAGMLVQGLTHAQTLGMWLQTYYLDKYLVVASFLSGATIFVWFIPFLLSRWSWRWLAGIGVGVCLLFCAFHSRWGGYSFSASLALAYFIATGMACIVTMASPRLVKESPDRLFLSLWLFATLMELVLVMGWTAGRYLLIGLAPLSWLFWDLLQDASWEKAGKWIGLFTLAVGAALAVADYAQAQVIVHFSHDLEGLVPRLESMAPRHTCRWYFLSDTFDGSQPYLLKMGWESAFPNQVFHPGDLLLRSTYRKSSYWVVPHADRFIPVVVFHYPFRLPLRVMDVPAGAGFYASCWGALPFVVTDHDLEKFEILQYKG